QSAILERHDAGALRPRGRTGPRRPHSRPEANLRLRGGWSLRRATPAAPWRACIEQLRTSAARADLLLADHENRDGGRCYHLRRLAAQNETPRPSLAVRGHD